MLTFFKRHLARRIVLYIEYKSLQKCISKGQFKLFSDSVAIIPQGNTWPLLGSLPSLIAAGSSPKLHLYIDKKHSELGPIFREVGFGGKSFLFLSHPDSIRKVFTLEGKYPRHFLPESWLEYNRINKTNRGLLFMEGEEWLKYRRILNQILLKDDFLEALKPVHLQVVEDLIKTWGNNLNTTISLEKDLYIHSLSFMLSTAMGSSYMESKILFTDQLKRLGNLYQEIFDSTSHLMLAPVKVARILHLPVWTKFSNAVSTSLKESSDLITNISKYSAQDGLLKKLKESGVNDSMSSRLLTDLMIAAGDTTAFTTLWALYLLGLEDAEKQTTFPIMGIMKEALRLYPAAPFLTRVLAKSTDILGYHINSGETVVMSMYSCGRNPAYFSCPKDFMPNRWEREEHRDPSSLSTTKNAFLPFALGVRSCVGKKLAYLQLHLTIESILKNYTVITKEKVNMILRLTPAPEKPIKIILEQRKTR